MEMGIRCILDILITEKFFEMLICIVLCASFVFAILCWTFFFICSNKMPREDCIWSNER